MELSQNIEANENKNETTGNVIDDDESENEENEWQPELVMDSISKGQIKSDKKSDIISILVEIYGTSELFVNEYRNLLADRLLNIVGRNFVGILLCCLLKIIIIFFFYKNSRLRNGKRG